MRRRELIAVSIVVVALFAMAWVDDQLVLRIPAELDAHARRVLAGLYPERRPHIDHIEVDFSSRRVVALNVTFSEKDSERTVLKVDRVELGFSLVGFQPRELKIKGVSTRLRLSKDGKLNIEDLVPATTESKSRPSLLAVTVEDVRIHFEGEDWGSPTLATCERAELTVAEDGRIQGSGQMRVGAVIAASSPFASGGTPLEGEPGSLYREIVPRLVFEIDYRPDGRLALPIEVQNVAVGPLLRSVLPRYVQDVIWDELNPTGLVDAHATLRYGGDFH